MYLMFYYVQSRVIRFIWICEYTPGFGSYYIEGINNLYEFDCGPRIWMDVLC